MSNEGGVTPSDKARVVLLAEVTPHVRQRCSGHLAVPVPSFGRSAEAVRGPKTFPANGIKRA